ncbi:MAG: DNA helicase RecQ [Verrucomicrobiia bacterium]
MKVLIVAKTRRGQGACVGGITQHGRSVRLVAVDTATNEHAGMEYEVGEVWEIETAPAPEIIPPHVEDVLVLHAVRLRLSDKVEQTIRRFMPPVCGGPDQLFQGLVQATSAGGLFVTERTGLPERSTLFWEPDQPLELDCTGKRIRYRYPTSAGGLTLTFVGFQEPLAQIPPGTLVRVSLAHRWRPKERLEEELRCFLQISGWFQTKECSRAFETATPPVAAPSATAPLTSALADPMSSALQVLKRTFGYSQFFPVQADVIHRILHGQDTLVVMPTGGGKSLCYQLPALILEGLTVVVSPLIALMQDQVRQLRELGIPVACLNHMVPLSEWTSITRSIRQGVTRILYVAPETLLRPEILLLLAERETSCLAIDEAHCISEWGHDFRPDYRKLRGVRERFPNAVCLGLTATATPRVRQDIRGLLAIPPDGELVASFNRPNLFISVQSRQDRLAQILHFLEKRRGESGIIYCGTRKQADELCVELNANGWETLPYHAGLEDSVRTLNQERFIRDEVPLIVATIAFGMGINKSNVRFVIHAHLPKDLESYYQEIGRAGRDGLRADCLLLYNRADAIVHRHFIDQGAASERPGRQARLNALIRFAETRQCRRVPLLNYFGETVQEGCNCCDRCVSKPSVAPPVDVTPVAQLFLSAVQQTGQSFGGAQIIAVLRGSRAERVLARRHDRLACYGQGKGHSEMVWRQFLDDFLDLGLLEQDLEFGGLRLTPKGRAVLDGRERVLVHRQEASACAEPTDLPRQHDPAAFDHLRRLRKELADQAGVPAYMIFSDATLTEMARVLPADEAQLLQISGVGQTKLGRYGNRFLEAIRAFRQQAGLPAVVASEKDDSPIVRPPKRRRFHEVGERFAAGETIAGLAEAYGVTTATILEHLHRFNQDGGQVDADRILAALSLPHATREQAIAAFERLGLDRLGPVFDALGGTVSYPDLHLLRAYLSARPPAGGGC